MLLLKRCFEHRNLEVKAKEAKLNRQQIQVSNKKL
mgnify:CR=1 FL=1|jgi:hypothetical protein